LFGTDIGGENLGTPQLSAPLFGWKILGDFGIKL